MFAKKDWLVPSIATICIIVLFFYGPIPQDQDYHNFADQRSMFGIPNFVNVITNLPFTFVALGGLWYLRGGGKNELTKMFLTLLTGFFLLTLGSGYYHWGPNDITLVYDRLPMVIIFMSFFSFIIYDRINRRTGYAAFFLLNIIGLLTVIYWIITEQAGQGDLRWYAMVQFYPIIAIPLILLIYGSPLSLRKEVISGFIFFTLAKLAEYLDKEIYYTTNHLVSGHSLKHLLMAAAEYKIIVMVGRRLKSI